LLAKKAEYRARLNYVPTLQWYYHVSQYVENEIDDDQLVESLGGSRHAHFGN